MRYVLTKFCKWKDFIQEAKTIHIESRCLTHFGRRVLKKENHFYDMESGETLPVTDDTIVAFLKNSNPRAYAHCIRLYASEEAMTKAIMEQKT